MKDLVIGIDMDDTICSTNELIIVEVPNTELNEFPLFELVSIVLVGLGAGVIFYAKRKKK